jgi:phosphate-transporting ATPase
VDDLRRPGLGPVSFELAAGECVAVQGPSGAGKSLLLRALADLDPNHGEVHLDGKRRDQLPAPAWRSRVMYVPAESGWWSERVGDHFTDWAAAVPLIEKLRLPVAVHDWPVRQLSTGERHRLALVRALVRQPRVLLLDEPTSGLDGEATVAVERLIAERLQVGVSVLWVTHDVAQAQRVARRCLYLEQGRVQEGLL